MSVLEWRKLNFFRFLIDVDHGKIKHNIKTDVTACACNSVQKIFCDSSGCVHIFYRNWESISFRATSSAVKYCCLTNENNSLITLSNVENTLQVLVKFWDLNKITKRNGAPCIGSAVIPALSAVSAMNALYKGSYYCVAIGFEGGEISLFRGTIKSDISVCFRSFQISTRRINGINFKPTNVKHINMFVCSDAGIFCYLVKENNDIRETQIILDTKTEPTSCCAFQASGIEDTYFIVGRDDAVYCYTSDGRGPCYAIEGKKKYIARFANYLLIVIHQTNTFSSKNKYLLIIIDICHKIIVLNKTMNSISGLLFENKNCFVLTDTNEMIALYERDINYKLELLLQNHLYDISLSLVKKECCDDKRLAQIYKLYGDYLYLKGDYSGAVKRYIKTLGCLEPYCIIRKFLDSKLVTYLLEYMEAILKSDNATEEHMQLFINCKSRINLPNKLREFLCEVDMDETSYKDIYCSINETITSNITLRQINDDINHEMCDTSLVKFLSIVNNISDVKKFLSRLNEHQIYSYFKEHSETLMKSYKQQTTEIFKSICERNFVSCDNTGLNSSEIFISLLINQEFLCIDFLEHIIKVVPKSTMISYNCLFEMYLRTWKSNNSISHKLLDFLELNYRKYDEIHILILCKLYSFWDGVIFLYQKNSLDNLSMRYYMQTGDSKNISSCQNFSKPQLCIQSLNYLDSSRESSVHIVNFILNENLKKMITSPLQIFQRISKIQPFRIAHVKEFYVQEFIKLAKDLKNESNIVKKMNDDQQEIKNLVRSFSIRPIEIRLIICNLCDQHIKHPAVFFLCHHTFHKHCLNLYSEENQDCVVCNGKGNEKKSYAESIYKDIPKLPTDYHTCIEKCIRKGLYNCMINKIDLDRRISSNPFETFSDNFEYTDPFTTRSGNQLIPLETDDTYSLHTSNKRDYYDANLNPFEG